MRKKILKIFIITILAFGLQSLGLAQKQTGTIWGIVADEEGVPLPGVKVTIASPAMMGIQSYMTRDKGDFRFPSCPPGKYTVKGELSGFQTIERPGVVVHVGMSINVSLKLKQTPVKEEVIVTAPSPMVDITSSKLVTPITEEMLQNIPLPRSIYDVVQTAPGTIAEGVSYRKMLSVHGGTLQETSYLIDGADITDPFRGYIINSISFDAIEEIEMGTGGHTAETGRITAGYINVVSKSGGNTFSGSFTGQYTGEKLQRSSIPDEQLDGLGLMAPTFDKYNIDSSLTLGGPIIKDRLWFFMNPQITTAARSTPNVPWTDPFGTFHDAFDMKRQYTGGFLKFTLKITENLKYRGTWQYNRMKEDPASLYVETYGPTMPYAVNLLYTDQSHALSNLITFIIDEDTFIEARVGYVYRYLDWLENEHRTTGRRLPLAWDYGTGMMFGGQNFDYLYRRKTLNGGLNLTRYQDDFLGANHEFKAGIDYLWWNCETSYVHTNPYYQIWFNELPWYYHESTPYMGMFYLFTPGPEPWGSPMLDQSWSVGIYVQDQITIKKRLTLMLGLRYDTSHLNRPKETHTGWEDTYYNGLANILLPEVFTTEDKTSPAIKDYVVWNILQPRVAITYDLFGDGKTALKASYSRYGQRMLANIGEYFHPYGYVYAAFLWYDNNQDGTYNLPPVDDYFAYYIPRITADPEELIKIVDPNMSSPYTDEITTGIQHELSKDFSLGLNFIYKVNKDIMETIDTANPLDGDMWIPYIVNDPGDDGLLNTDDDKNVTAYALDKNAEIPLEYRTNVEGLKRKYWAFELVLFKRMSSNWQLSGSVTYSKQYGNIGSGTKDSDTNIGTYADPNNLVNAWGRQTWDRPLVIKLMGTVILPYGINLSAYYRHYDGEPYNRTTVVYFPSTLNGFEPKIPSATINAEPPGSKRHKGFDYLDIRVEKTFNLGPGRLGVYIDLFNVFGYSRIKMELDNGGHIFADGTFNQYPTFGTIRLAEGVRAVNLSLRYTF